MKIESSSVQMGAAYSSSQTTMTKTTVIDYCETGTEYAPPSDSFSSSDSLSIQDRTGIMNSQKPGNLLFVSLKDSMSADEYTRNFHEKVFRRIVEIMRNLIHERNFISYPDTGSALTGMQTAPSGLQKQVWYRYESTESLYSEQETATFGTTGMVKTEDGRTIPFNLSLSLSRSFQEYTSLTSETMGSVVEMYDPLVINMNIPSASVSDQSFLFDIDCDGKKDTLSMLGEGSGFLALDKNGDGIINDGSELFGAGSGDGFADLAAYDSDKNGWIDENDFIYESLKVWTKDPDGKDRLLSLKEADVGAIFLGNVHTGFDLRDDENNTRARIQSTGIYLHESTGAAGTVQHVDFAV